MEARYGIIERGKIIGSTDDGYIIASLDRDGIETPALQPIDDKEYSSGDRVYYFYFNDGTGKILSEL